MTVVAVGFDLDYTLCVPERPRAVLLDEATDAVDAPAIERHDYLEAHRRNLTGETREPIFGDLLEGRADADAGELARAYREAINGAIAPVEGAERLVSGLRGRYRVGLLTNGPTVAQRGKLRTLGWEDAFDAAVISGDLPAGKPDARAFGALCDALGAEPGETVYVGDEVEADVRGAHEAGLRVVQVCFSGGPDPDPRADAHVDRAELVSRLPSVIESF